MSEGPDLRVSEADQPDDEGVQHVLIIEHAVLALLYHTLYELHKVDLMGELVSMASTHTLPQTLTLNFLYVGPYNMRG